jgi:hypothetical protein
VLRPTPAKRPFASTRRREDDVHQRRGQRIVRRRRDGRATHWGPDQGIVEVAISEFSGDQPVMAMFNAGEKRRGPGGVRNCRPARNAATIALNARYTSSISQNGSARQSSTKKCLA